LALQASDVQAQDVQASVNAGWARHAESPEEVLRDTLSLVDTVPAEGVAALANLLFHVGGEHLGRFVLVESSIGRLLAVAESPAAAAPLHRLLAACALCSGSEEQARPQLAQAAGDPVVNRGIVLGLAACALAAQESTPEAAAHFEAAVALAEATEGLVRSVAVTGNNLAVSLEQRAQRSPEQDALMLRAAHVARIFWEKAGTWLNVERAEYRLAMTHLARGEAPAAAEHAERVLSIVRENGGDPGEAFFGWEVLARARHAGGDTEGARAARDQAAACAPNVVDEGFRSACLAALGVLDGHLEHRALLSR
jgi:tetratricopeptide (TPR) repeat protein